MLGKENTLNIFTQMVVPVGRVSPDAVEMLGTAFVVSSEGYFATSRHVVGNTSSGLVILAPHLSSMNQYQDVADSRCQVLPTEIVETDPVKDLSLLKADFHFQGSLPGISGLDEVSVGDELGIFGFPHCVEGRRVLTFQSTLVGAKVLLSSNGIKSKCAVVNIQSRPGQSGSLVFSPKTQRIVGMLIGTYAPDFGIRLGNMNPAELNQTTHVISAEYLKEML